MTQDAYNPSSCHTNLVHSDAPHFQGFYSFVLFVLLCLEIRNISVLRQIQTLDCKPSMAVGTSIICQSLHTSAFTNRIPLCAHEKEQGSN